MRAWPAAGVDVRAERPGEEPAIRELVRAAFGTQRVADLVDALRASRDWIAELSLVASVDGTLGGYAAFTRGSWTLLIA